jgi:nucleoside transporter
MENTAKPSASVRNRLFIMMLLEFFIWGAWLPLIFGYMPAIGFTPGQQSWVLNAFPIAAIVGMFFSNQFADRNFSGERFLAFSHLVGGLAMLGLGFTKSFAPFFTLMLIHCLLYVPTISITNSVAFASMKDAEKEFGIVRMGGTIGWILAAWPFTFIFVDWAKVGAMNKSGMEWLKAVLGTPLSGQAMIDATKWTYIVSGVASLALAAFSLTLPHTPPRKAEGGAVQKFAWLEAVSLLKHPFVLILWLVTLVDSFVHNCYFNWTGRFLASPTVGIPENWIMPVMSAGQISEILTMAVLGGVLKKLGWRATMVVGILGHAARFAAYAFFPNMPWLIVTVQVLHGICYAFFFATVYIFVDAYFPKDVRNSAQGLFNVMILGIGSLVAGSICPSLFASFTKDNVTDFRSLFLVPCMIALVAAVVLALFFRPPKKEEVATAGAAPQAEGAKA